MAKSIRSKSKRKNRTEFRNTIGTEAAKANMAIIQAKLQECVNSGQMNSFDRLSNLFSGNNGAADGGSTPAAANDRGAADDDAGEDVVMSGGGGGGGKDPSKIPTKRKSKGRVGGGMYGDRTTKKVGERISRQNRRGRGRESADGRRRRSSSKKRRA